MMRVQVQTGVGRVIRKTWLVVTLVIMLVITFNIANSIHEQNKKFAEHAFAEQVNNLRQIIDSRMHNHEHILLGAAGLFAASESVERDEFRTYINQLNLSDIYPGIQAVGYAQWLRPDQLAGQVKLVQADGLTDFAVKPAGLREHYAPIIYIEPFAKRNLVALGFDMFSEPVRQQAMRYAVDNDVTSMSGKVKLIQENQSSVQPGVLMYLPIYKKQMPLGTAELRWKALEGFVYSPFRMGDLMEGVLLHRSIDLDFDLYAGNKPVPEQLLYSSQSHSSERQARYSQRIILPLYGQEWCVVARSDANFEAKNNSALDSLILIFGSVLSIVICFLFYILSSQRQRAMAIAEEMTIDVREKNKALKLGEERFSLALESSSMGIWSWQFADNSVQWDESMCVLFGMHGEKIVTDLESLLTHIHIEDRKRVQQELVQSVDGKKIYDTEYRIVWSDNSIHYLASRAKIIYEDYIPVSMIGICWDITERKRLDKIKSEFVSTVSHELRTPLTSISGALGLVTSGALGELPEKSKQLLDIAYKNSQRLKLLINDLLDMDKLFSNKLEFNCEVQPLMPLVDVAVTESQQYANQFNVQYVIKNMMHEPYISVERTRFLQVMENFLSNAAKFSAENSQVIVIVELVEGGWVRISVMDSGIGIAEDAQAHIFEKFYQADSSDTRKTGGVGLGLAISKEIVERMQGRVGFQSLIGVGSTFYMEFMFYKKQDV